MKRGDPNRSIASWSAAASTNNAIAASTFASAVAQNAATQRQASSIVSQRRTNRRLGEALTGVVAITASAGYVAGSIYFQTRSAHSDTATAPQGNSAARSDDNILPSALNALSTQFSVFPGLNEISALPDSEEHPLENGDTCPLDSKEYSAYLDWLSQGGEDQVPAPSPEKQETEKSGQSVKF